MYAFDSATPNYEAPLNTHIDMSRNDSLPAIAGYTFYSATGIEDIGAQLTIDLHAEVDGTTYTEDYQPTYFLGTKLPYVPPTNVTQAQVALPSSTRTNNNSSTRSYTHCMDFGFAVMIMYIGQLFLL